VKYFGTYYKKQPRCFPMIFGFKQLIKPLYKKIIMYIKK